MSLRGQVLAEKYDFSQFHDFMEIVENDYALYKDILLKNTDLSCVVLSKNLSNNISKENCSFIEGDIDSPKFENHKLYIVNDFFKSNTPEKVANFLKNLYNSTEEYSRLLIVEDAKFAEKIEEIKMLLFQLSFIITNAFHISDFILIETVRL